MYIFIVHAASLNKVLRSVGDLTSVWMSVDRKEWDNVVIPNVQHILRSIVLALVYLHERNVQHCDIKGMLHFVLASAVLYCNTDSRARLLNMETKDLLLTCLCSRSATYL